MRRPWFKLHAELLRDRNFRRQKWPARWLFIVCCLEACECNRDGLLAERTGNLTIDDLADDSGLGVVQVKEHAQTLVKTGFLELVAGAYSVMNWEKYQPKLDSTAAERMERLRARRRINP